MMEQPFVLCQIQRETHAGSLCHLGGEQETIPVMRY